jgi:hypothetical protein
MIFKINFSDAAGPAQPAWRQHRNVLLHKNHSFTLLPPPARHGRPPSSLHEQWRLSNMQIKNLLLATAATAVLGLAGTQSAKADWYGHGPGPGPVSDPGYGHGWYDANHCWHVYPGYYAPPPPRYYAPAPRYYAPPPRYYAPPVYYAHPVVTFGIRP